LRRNARGATGTPRNIIKTDGFHPAPFGVATGRRKTRVSPRQPISAEAVLRNRCNHDSHYLQYRHPRNRADLHVHPFFGAGGTKRQQDGNGGAASLRRGPLGLSAAGCSQASSESRGPAGHQRWGPGHRCPTIQDPGEKPPGRAQPPGRAGTKGRRKAQSPSKNPTQPGIRDATPGRQASSWAAEAPASGPCAQ